MFNGEIISHNISNSPNLEQIYDMLDKAFDMCDNLDGLVLHSDQGWQYQHFGYRKRLEAVSYTHLYIKQIQEGILNMSGWIVTTLSVSMNISIPTVSTSVHFVY